MTSITVLGLSCRVETALLGEDITTVEAVLLYPPWKMPRLIRGFGKTSLRELERALKECGFADMPALDAAKNVINGADILIAQIEDRIRRLNELRVVLQRLKE